jgi:hypothetical protein
VDYDLDTAGTSATFNPFDDTTAAAAMPVFGAYDDGNDRELDSELIYRLPEQRIAVDGLESGRFFSLAMDATGNLSEPKELKRKPQSTPNCDLLDAKRAAILDVLEQSLTIAHNDGWLLDYSHVSILEQGSGTCLWQTDSCALCEEVYSPSESDHDYEVLLRVFVSGVPAGFTADPHSSQHRQGDWYFKAPVLVGNQWQYTRPGGGALVRPGSEPPLTPGDIITSRMKTNVFLLGYAQPDPALGITHPLLPDISFFPVRYDHFTNAVLDLEPPQTTANSGDDPIGDAGLGRQLLLLKWVLEGVYVPVPNLPIDPGYDLDTVFNLMRSRGEAGIPVLEGYEWSQLQLHAALDSGLMLRVNDPRAPVNPELANRDFLYNLKRKQIKRAGKTAIRAALAQLAGSDEADRADLLFSVDRSLMQSLDLKSFEEVAAFIVKQKPGLFGPFASRLEDFVAAKLARPNFVDELVVDDCKLNQFLADSVNLLFKVSQESRPNWDDTVALLPANELFFRTNNLQILRDGFPAVNRAGLTELLNQARVTLPVRLINDSDQPAQGVTATMTVGGGGTITLTTNIAARGHVLLASGPFTLTRALTSGSPQPVTLTVTGGGISGDVRIANNWIGLESHILDLTDPCNVPPLVIPPPTGLAPVNPEATRMFRRNDFFDPGFKPAALAAAFASHFGVPPQRIYVVGSQMLGAADANSDIDVIFVTDVINPVTSERLSKGDNEAFPFFKAINPHLIVPSSATHLGNAANDPEAVEIGNPDEVADPDQKARTMPKRGVIDPFFENFYEVNRFGFLVWPQ